MVHNENSLSIYLNDPASLHTSCPQVLDPMPVVARAEEASTVAQTEAAVLAHMFVQRLMSAQFPVDRSTPYTSTIMH
jgi:hypothetical protein